MIVVSTLAAGSYSYPLAATLVTENVTDVTVSFMLPVVMEQVPLEPVVQDPVPVYPPLHAPLTTAPETAAPLLSTTVTVTVAVHLFLETAVVEDRSAT